MKAKYLSIEFYKDGFVSVETHTRKGKKLFRRDHPPGTFTGPDLVRIMKSFPEDNRPGILKVGVLN